MARLNQSVLDKQFKESKEFLRRLRPEMTESERIELTMEIFGDPKRRILIFLESIAEPENETPAKP